MANLILTNVSVEFSVSNVKRSKIFPSLKYGKPKEFSDSSKKINVLSNINLNLSSGDRLGIIGPNGAGKTTLLRVMGDLLRPTTGTAKIDGQVTPLIYSLPFINPNLNAHDNIVNFCNINKISEHRAFEIVNDVFEFAELGEFFFQPLFTYSTGMNSRFMFGLSTAITSNILIIDEGIGAGDAAFHRKAQERLDGFYNNFEILVIASHSMDLIRDYCDKACFIKGGEIVGMGDVEHTIEAYLDYAI